MKDKRLHKVLVEILDYVVDICDKNNLSYFLAYGTALGAYRHKGFIPWDDDIDIAMPRKDYEKLLSILRNIKNEKYNIQDENNEKKYFLTFAKVRKNNTLLRESIAVDVYDNNGIYIDIFPVDDIEECSSIKAKLKYFVINYLIHSLKFSECSKLYLEKLGKTKYFMHKIICFPVSIFSNKSVLQKIKKIVIKEHDENNRFLVVYDDVKSKAIIEKNFVYPLRKLEFEGKLYNVPGCIEKYLTHLYGSNYMELPPIEQRVTHNHIELRFDLDYDEQ